MQKPIKIKFVFSMIEILLMDYVSTKYPLSCIPTSKHYQCNRDELNNTCPKILYQRAGSQKQQQQPDKE